MKKLARVAFDQPDAMRLEQLIKGGGQQRRVYQREIVGKRADDGHQMQASVFAVPERQIVAMDLDAKRPKQVRHLLNAVLVCPHAAPDGQRLAVDPDAIAAFDLARVRDPPETGIPSRV